MTNLDLADLMADLELRFTSANEIPVERASLRATEWRALKAHIGELRTALRQISRMNGFPDASTNLMTISAARQIARQALESPDEPTAAQNDPKDGSG